MHQRRRAQIRPKGTDTAKSARTAEGETEARLRFLMFFSEYREYTSQSSRPTDTHIPYGLMERFENIAFILFIIISRSKIHDVVKASVFSRSQIVYVVFIEHIAAAAAIQIECLCAAFGKHILRQRLNIDSG